jgi:hypothetical protein
VLNSKDPDPGGKLLTDRSDLDPDPGGQISADTYPIDKFCEVFLIFYSEFAIELKDNKVQSAMYRPGPAISVLPAVVPLLCCRGVLSTIPYTLISQVELILEQMRLCLATKDYIRTQIISKKISTRFFEDGKNDELKLKFYQ